MRRAEVVKLLLEYGCGRGVRARIACELGVHPSTISRDVKIVLAPPSEQKCYCPTCGTSVSRETYELLVA